MLAIQTGDYQDKPHVEGLRGLHIGLDRFLSAG